MLIVAHTGGNVTRPPRVAGRRAGGVILGNRLCRRGIVGRGYGYLFWRSFRSVAVFG